jgi:transcriptional regulator with XRE-family HTH domain
MSAPAPRDDDRAFARRLRHWRHARGVSQLALAADAEVSIRHLSFLETGRARPSREMVERLTVALDVPLADRNAVLMAAGFAPVYGQRELGAPELAHVRRALDFILRQQEPYPAIVVDGRGDVVMRNGAARRVFDLFLDSPPLGRREARNALRATFHPDGLRRFIVNWEDLAGALVAQVHRDAAASPDAAALRDELLAYPGVPARWRTPHPGVSVPPLLTMRLQRGDLRLAFFSTITVLATPQDVTLQQLRIECFHPADAETEATAARLAATVPAAHGAGAEGRAAAPGAAQAAGSASV